MNYEFDLNLTDYTVYLVGADGDFEGTGNYSDFDEPMMDADDNYYPFQVVAWTIENAHGDSFPVVLYGFSSESKAVACIDAYKRRDAKIEELCRECNAEIERVS